MDVIPHFDAIVVEKLENLKDERATNHRKHILGNSDASFKL